MKNLKDYKKICFFDTETTGINTRTAKAVEIGGIITDPQGNIIDTFETKVKVRGGIPLQASKVHGIYTKDTMHSPTERKALLSFITWLEKNEVDLMIGYNSRRYDLPLLKNRAVALKLDSRYFRTCDELDGYYDLVKIAKEKDLYNLGTTLGRKWQLSLVSAILGINVENAHTAMADSKMLKNIWFKLQNEIYVKGVE